MEYLRVSGACENLASFDYIGIKRSLASFAVWWGLCADVPYAQEMFAIVTRVLDLP